MMASLIQHVIRIFTILCAVAYQTNSVEFSSQKAWWNYNSWQYKMNGYNWEGYPHSISHLCLNYSSPLKIVDKMTPKIFGQQNSKKSENRIAEFKKNSELFKFLCMKTKDKERQFSYHQVLWFSIYLICTHRFVNYRSSQ